MDFVYAILALVVLPILLTKTTERGRFDFVHPYLREAWTGLILVYAVAYWWSEKEAMAHLHSRFDSHPILAYCAVAILGAIFACVSWAVTGLVLDKAESRQQEPPKQDGSQLKSRLGGVIVEGAQIKKLCEAISMPYTTPATNRPDIANAIANWQMRVDVVLSLDSDPRAAKIWNRAVLYSAPTPQPSIAIYCTVLNVKLDALKRIQRVISTSSQQQIAQLQNLIAEGSTLRDSCMNNDNLNSVIQQEVNWVGKTSDWLTDNIDESYSREFNSSPLNDGMLMPGNHPPELAAIWKRTKGRMDTLERFAREVNAKPLS
jgi:hypothetical protein